MLQHSELSILENEESSNDWFSMLNFWIDNFNLVQLISDDVRLLEEVVINCTVSLFIFQMLCQSVSTAIHDLVPIGAVR